MADSFSLDDSELRSLAADLAEVASSAGAYVRDAVNESSLNIKTDWRERATGMKGLPHYPKTISYTFSGFQGFGATVLRSDIGPTKRGQGNLGAIIEYGSPSFTARGYGDAALAGEQGNYVELLDQALKNAEAVLTFQGILRSVGRGVNQ
jgi:hypothetical protein